MSSAVEVREGRYGRESPEFDRAIAFIDATFAVALTLLITTLDVEDPADAFASVSAFGEAAGAQLLAYAIAFVVVAGYWLAHHRMVAEFAAIDRPTIVANLFLIAAIVLLPFTTKSVGDPDVEHLALPTVLMAVDLALVSLLHLLVWVLAARRGLLDHAATAGEVRERVIGGLAAPIVFLLSVPIAFLVSADAARLCWLVQLVTNPGAGILAARDRRARGEG